MEELVIQLLKEMREEQKELNEKSALHREETLKWQSEASQRLGAIEIDLREHKEGVIQNRSVLAENSKRLEKLEEPSKFKEKVYAKCMKLFKFTAAAGAAVGVVGKYLNWF